MQRTNRKLRTTDLTYAALFVALMAIGANITSIVPFMVIGGIPITLQTFFALLAGLILGSRLGTISMIVYTLVGLIGVRVFAQFQGGPGIVLQPTFGFILAFIFTAYLTGTIVEKAKSKIRFMVAAIIGILFIYLLGTNLMYISFMIFASANKIPAYGALWGSMLVILPKDIILAIIAGVIAPKIRQALLRTSNLYTRQS